MGTPNNPASQAGRRAADQKEQTWDNLTLTRSRADIRSDRQAEFGQNDPNFS